MRLPRRRVAPVRTACTARFFVAAVLVFLTAIGAFGQIRFRDVASEAGVDFVLESGPTPRKPMIEAVAGGVAAFDADEDGLIDIYFVNGADAGSLRKRGPSHWNRLYRNLGGMRFSDVTETSGVSGIGYSMGVAVGDYDNDGDGDLFVAGYRANILYRNNGRGEFTNVTSEAGITSSGWSVAAGWFDYDRDGALDLLVVNYLDWDPADDRFCGDRDRGLRIYTAARPTGPGCRTPSTGTEATGHSRMFPNCPDCRGTSARA